MNIHTKVILDDSLSLLKQKVAKVIVLTLNHTYKQAWEYAVRMYVLTKKNTCIDDCTVTTAKNIQSKVVFTYDIGVNLNPTVKYICMP